MFKDQIRSQKDKVKMLGTMPKGLYKRKQLKQQETHRTQTHKQASVVWRNSLTLVNIFNQNHPILLFSLCMLCFLMTCSQIS